MIRYNPKDWVAIVVHGYSSTVIKVLFPILAFMGIFTLALAYTLDYYDINYKSTTAIHSLMGIVLGLFLVFRTNSAYDRWWEGRKQWGALVNNTRTLAMKINAFVDRSNLEARDYFVKMIPNFVYATKEHLRDNFIEAEIDEPKPGLIEQLKDINHKPNKISGMMYEKVQKLYKQGKISGDQLFLLDKELKSFLDILGACERIKNTPIPYSYSMFIKKFIFTFTITLPFGIVTDFHYWTVPIVLLIFYILVSIELISEEIEDPFGRDLNDLPTDDLASKIKSNINEILK